MRLLGLPPGPLVGQAWRFLKDLRLDNGPLPHDEAMTALYAWARERGIEPPAP
jgi:poly(A) polymerase